MKRILVLWSMLLGFAEPGASVAMPQSLAEAARKEADRRESLRQEGIEGRVVEPGDLRRAQGNVTVSSPEYALQPPMKDPFPFEKRGSLHSFRTALKKLDREIQEGDHRLVLLRARIEAERWAMPKSGRPSRGGGTASEERMRTQVQELEIRLKRLRQERLEIYQTGRKAGFLPGELEGRGIIP